MAASPGELLLGHSERVDQSHGERVDQSAFEIGKLLITDKVRSYYSSVYQTLVSVPVLGSDAVQVVLQLVLVSGVVQGGGDGGPGLTRDAVVLVSDAVPVILQLVLELGAVPVILQLVLESGAGSSESAAGSLGAGSIPELAG